MADTGNSCSEVKKLKLWIYLVYILPAVGWLVFFIVYLPCSFRTNLLLALPCGLCLVYLIYGCITACRSPCLGYPPKVTEESHKIDYERTAFRWIVEYANLFMLAITIILLIAVTQAHLINIFSENGWPFFLFSFLALGVAACFVFPFIWLGERSLKHIVIYRHFKTAVYTIMVFFFFSALIVLLQVIFDKISV